jgi:hypothetical protein
MFASCGMLVRWFHALACSCALLLLPALRGAVTVRPVAPPAAGGSLGPALTLAPDGTAMLSWLEPAGAAWALKFSRFEEAATRWTAPRVIVQSAELVANWADFPQLAVGTDGRLTAVWSVNNPVHQLMPGHHGAGYRAIYAHSKDGGKTWSPELPVSDEALPVEFVALQPLPDGRMLAAWLDGRAHQTGVDRQALYARILDGPGADVAVDALVCDCCQLSLAPTAGGGALLGYRGRTPDEIRDIQLARFDGKSWQKLGALQSDAWKIAGCPVNGPQLAAAGDRVGAVWFTAADNQPRVLARVSQDGGRTFGATARIDLGRPQGRVDNVLLPDGTLVVTWLESTAKDGGAEGGIYLRTWPPNGELSAPQLLAPSRTSRTTGFPRLVALGGKKLLLAGTRDGDATQVLAFLIELD